MNNDNVSDIVLSCREMRVSYLDIAFIRFVELQWFTFLALVVLWGKSIMITLAEHEMRGPMELLRGRPFTDEQWNRVVSEMPAEGNPEQTSSLLELAAYRMPNGSRFVTLIDASEATWQEYGKLLASRSITRERVVKLTGWKVTAVAPDGETIGTKQFTDQFDADQFAERVFQRANGREALTITVWNGETVSSQFETA